jgi:glycerate kinase
MDDSQNGGTGFTNAFVNLPTTAGGPGTLDAYLIGTDGKLVTTQTVNTIGSVKRIAAFMTLPSPGVVVTDASTSFVLGYNNTKGAQVSTQSSVTPSRVSKFGNGPFDMTVTVN